MRLREPLMTWCAALDRLDPGRVVWGLPVDGHLLDAPLGSLPTA